MTEHSHEIKLADMGIATVYEKLKEYDQAMEIYKSYSLKDKMQS
jgi:hypothetical protein